MNVVQDGIKINLLGDFGVGKSTLIYTFRYQQPPPDNYIAEGIDFYQKKIVINEKEINLLIFDHPENRFYEQWFPSYFKNTRLIILCYDVTNLASFKHLTNWINIIESYRKSSLLILLGLKKDLLENTENRNYLSNEQIDSFMRKNTVDFSTTLSSRDIQGINNFFEKIIEFIQ